MSTPQLTDGVAVIFSDILKKLARGSTSPRRAEDLIAERIHRRSASRRVAFNAPVGQR